MKPAEKSPRGVYAECEVAQAKSVESILRMDHTGHDSPNIFG